MAKILRIEYGGREVYSGPVLGLTWNEDDDSIQVQGRLRPKQSIGDVLARLSQQKNSRRAALAHPQTVGEAADAAGMQLDGSVEGEEEPADGVVSQDGHVAWDGSMEPGGYRDDGPQDEGMEHHV